MKKKYNQLTLTNLNLSQLSYQINYQKQLDLVSMQTHSKLKVSIQLLLFFDPPAQL